MEPRPHQRTHKHQIRNREGLTSGHLLCSTPRCSCEHPPMDRACPGSIEEHALNAGQSYPTHSEDSGVRRRRTAAATRRAAQPPRRAAQVALRKSQMSSDSERLPRRAHPQPDAAVATSGAAVAWSNAAAASSQRTGQERRRWRLPGRACRCRQQRSCRIERCDCHGRHRRRLVRLSCR